MGVGAVRGREALVGELKCDSCAEGQRDDVGRDI